MRRDGRHRGFNPTQNPLLIMLLMQIYQELSRLEIKPIVTIALLVLNIGTYMFPYQEILGIYIYDVGRNSLNPRKIVNSFLYGVEENVLVRDGLNQMGRWFASLFPDNPLRFPGQQASGSLLTVSYNRLLLSSVIHNDDMHLYYNMLSLLFKGINLERHMGSEEFLFLVVFSLVISHTLHVIISYSLFEIIGLSSADAKYDTNSIGFSAVLFSLKFVWNHFDLCELSNIWGINVLTKYAAWAELLVISIVSPNTSFLGHFSGILAGVLYIHVARPLLLYSGRQFSQQTRRGYTPSGNQHANLSGQSTSYRDIRAEAELLRQRRTRWL